MNGRTIETAADDALVIAGVALSSRLFIGTAGYPTQSIMVDAVEASGAEVVTASIRRVSLQGHGSDTVRRLKGYRFLPNTAGCETARDAIMTADLAREALDTNWIKVEVIGDRETLYPDVSELLAACRHLVDDGFVVLPYCNDDPVVCQRLADIGCAAVMPMGSLIGSGMGVANPANLELICRRGPVCRSLSMPESAPLPMLWSPWSSARRAVFSIPLWPKRTIRFAWLAPCVMPSRPVASPILLGESLSEAALIRRARSSVSWARDAETIRSTRRNGPDGE